MTFFCEQFHKRYLSQQSFKINLKITYLKFYQNLPGANELMKFHLAVVVKVMIWWQILEIDEINSHGINSLWSSNAIRWQGTQSTLAQAGLCWGCVLGTFSTLKSGMSPIILTVGANVPTHLRFVNGSITEVTPEKLQMSPYFSMVWVICPHFSKALAEHCSGNGLLPEGTKPLPEPMLTYHQWGPVAFIRGYYHEKIWRYQSVK